MSCVSAVQESRAEESYEFHELGLITSRVTCLQDGVAPVTSLGAPASKGYHAKLGSTLASTPIHGHILEGRKRTTPGDCSTIERRRTSNNNGSSQSDSSKHDGQIGHTPTKSPHSDNETHKSTPPNTGTPPQILTETQQQQVPRMAIDNSSSNSSDRSISMTVESTPILSTTLEYKTRLPPSESSLPRIVQHSRLEDHSDVIPSEADRECVLIAAECLHAQDCTKMIQILSHVQNTEHTYTVICVEFGLSLAHFKLKRYSDTRQHLQKLEQLSKPHPRYVGNASLAHYYLGEVDFTQAKYADAARHYAQAITYFSTKTVAEQFRVIPPSRSTIHTRRAGALRNNSKIMDAVQAYRQAIATADSKKDELSAHTSLGNLFQSVGENASALAEYEHSIKLSEELRDYVSLGWAHGNMGNAYLGLYQRDKGLYHLEKALDLTVEHEPTPQAIGRAYNNLGTAFQALNELDKAQDNYDLALSQAIYGNDVAGQARVYGNIGNLLMLQKKFGSAIAHYSETLTITSDKSTRSTAYHNRGCAEYEKAESEKRSLTERPDSAISQGKFEVQYHGPDFRDIEFEHQPLLLPDSILQQYRHASQDLSKVVSYHEETFQTIKGSSKGLTLSVSLFETNSRTFHRLQDCLYNLGEWHQALCYAEQSRARSLGELMLQKKGGLLDHKFTSPLTIDQITEIVKAEEVDVVFLSYTGARLLVWVLSPIEDSVSINMFHVALEDNQFEGKSLDYYVRYSLQDILIEKNVEMYASCNYSQPSSPITLLHNLIAEPLMKIFKGVRDPESRRRVRDVILIPDSYTHLIPIVALLDLTNGENFLGDRYRFRTMPSLLTMGIMKQLPQVVVNVPEDSQKFCVVGNPTIPQFMLQDETWNLGKLPFATEEAEWVAHILKCTPTLHEQATKMLVLSMISNSKVVHLATHGSAAAGFLAFASMGSSRRGQPPDEKMVLIYPEDIERLSISPALVVLSSCDSARGTVKADGILGMARAFILAGAQAVLTTLWRVPDESASVFMQFFYQYLMDGLKASISLQKAILSVRCFLKYSQYIHWSGYQLTGREIQFRVGVSPGARVVQTRVGPGTTFPRLEILKRFETVFVREPQPPTDVQLLHGSHGLKPTEPVIDFISRYHIHFPGGVFWVNGMCPELILGAAECIRSRHVLPATVSQPMLVVLDNIQSLPTNSEYLMTLLGNHHTHIIVTLNSSVPPDSMVREIDHHLLRGTSLVQVRPLSTLHTTQRMVHTILSCSHFTPHNREQRILNQLAEKTCGSPEIVDITSSLLQQCLEESEEEEGEGEGEFLEQFISKIQEPVEGESPISSEPPSPPPSSDEAATVEQEVLGEFTDTQFTLQLINACDLPHTDYFLLCVLSTFGPVPVPRDMVETVQSLVVTAKFGKPSQARNTPLANLLAHKLVRVYPSTIIAAPSGVQEIEHAGDKSLESEFYYVPQLVSDALDTKMEQVDKVFSITTAYRALLQFSKELVAGARLYFATGLMNIIVKLCDRNSSIIDMNCYREAYRLYVSCKARLSQDTLEQPHASL